MRVQKANIIAAHMIGWLLFIMLVGGFNISMHEGEPWTQIFSLPYLLFFGFYFILFYLNAEVLFPKLYLKQQYTLYFSIAFLLFLVVFFIQPFDQLVRLHDGGPHPPGSFRGPPPPFDGPRPQRRRLHIDITGIILFLVVWLIGSFLQIIKDWRLSQQRAARAEAEKVNAELSFLKAQINPHFLFNTLNNIYSMAITNHEQTAASIMKLSNIMRYVTDEASNHFVSLQSEVNCMRDYIDLQRMRLSDRAHVSFSVTGNLEGIAIAPLLLMTYIENVFKYGISNHEPSKISISIETKNGTIVFFCQNRIFTTERRTERTGIGLKNARLRLQQSYPDHHILSITTDHDLYTVQLTLQTS
jgi:two-component system, LytTR family, sensor kinase